MSVAASEGTEWPQEGPLCSSTPSGGDLSSGCPGHSSVEPVGTEAGGLGGGMMAFVTRWQGDV